MTVPAPRSADVRVLVVDDAPAFRAAAAAVVARTPGFVVVGEAADGATALQRVAELGPELVLLDLHLPDADGTAVCTDLVRRRPPPRVLLCSTYAAADLPPQALTCGADAYLPKDDLRPSVLRTLWARAVTPPAGRPRG